MATDVQEHTTEEKIAKLRELFADAPEVGKRRWRTCSRS